MSAYNFQLLFADPIKAGIKCSTIRARRKNGYVPAVGERIRLYAGQRTMRCELLREVEVKLVTPILIDEGENSTALIIINASVLAPEAALQIAMRDGFNSLQSFAEFFKSKRGLPFAGYLIEW